MCLTRAQIAKTFCVAVINLKMAFVKHLNVWKYVSNAAFNGVYDEGKVFKI